jgi:hypothetical protein
MGCGIQPILDNTTMRFACDFANVVLKSFVADYSVVIRKQVVDEIRAIAQKKQAETPPSPSGKTEPEKCSIVLTD